MTLECIKYRCLRITLGLSQSTHVQTVEVIAAIELLTLRFSMLNQRYMKHDLAIPIHPDCKLTGIFQTLPLKI
jgi:hypothetical protein